ncbi:ribonuclease H-like domain-containing protein [Croceibacterium ferulae]|uniref:ribonuclease H-like domain-containing protein n=1 Tax=Croceibacterium ferulae TaxID=1854641 RepID=UPI0013903A04|nr:ribonuclease H-like domain-containing protein [Croceibacterium ferulae]
MKTVTLDIETIPDLDACQLAGVDPAEGFPAWPLHQMLCVSLLTCERIGWDEHRFEIETFSRSDHGERAIVAEVERRLQDATMVQTFNGRAFDLPVLLARAAVTGEETPALQRAGSRSSAGFHHDLMDTVTNSGAAVRPKLVELCAGLGIPAKLELGSSSVSRLAAAREFARIGRYCEQDVVSTWLAARRWEASHDPQSALAMWSKLATWIGEHQPRLAHLTAYTKLPDLQGGGRALDPVAVAAIRF